MGSRLNGITIYASKRRRRRHTAKRMTLTSGQIMLPKQMVHGSTLKELYIFQQIRFIIAFEFRILYFKTHHSPLRPFATEPHLSNVSLIPYDRTDNTTQIKKMKHSYEHYTYYVIILIYTYSNFGESVFFYY